MGLQTLIKHPYLKFNHKFNVTLFKQPRTHKKHFFLFLSHVQSSKYFTTSANMFWSSSVHFPETVSLRNEVYLSDITKHFVIIASVW